MFGQERYSARFEWGPSGADAVAAGAAFVAVVDVLSFTTALSVAVENGVAVMPYPWRDGTEVAAAARYDAELAVGRSAAGPDEISLSPAAIRRVATGRRIERLVLPSPNGSAICARLSAAGSARPAGEAVTVLGVCLRNAAIAGEWVRARLAGRPVAVVAAGERWPDGSLRPAVEDLWGAGAFLAGFSDLSPEAESAVAAYRAVAGRVPAALAAAASGRELAALDHPGAAARSFAEDVAIAAEVDASTAVPVLQDGWFRRAEPTPPG
ncbi:2-phosphosulfolactate phosphatase [Actinoplanes palleronii]|uniref:2-phosphosulfolactate phosphatase n=1 Tax=Actinoplanes palleronii TaxID=113570 RepID=UPI001942497D|nr:2-phosphosulfolactate phosphatase [Actinoplanes palleronii]